MARTRDRQRALARAKLDRQIARRAAAARKRRQIQAGTAAGLALVLVVLGALWFSGFFEPDPDKPDKRTVTRTDQPRSLLQPMCTSVGGSSAASTGCPSKDPSRRSTSAVF